MLWLGSIVSFLCTSLILTRRELARLCILHNHQKVGGSVQVDLKRGKKKKYKPVASLTVWCCAAVQQEPIGFNEVLQTPGPAVRHTRPFVKQPPSQHIRVSSLVKNLPKGKFHILGNCPYCM